MMPEGTPFTKIEKKAEEMSCIIQLTQFWLKPKASSVFLINCQFNLSQGLAISDLTNIPGSFLLLRECNISWTKMIPSDICRPSTKPIFSREIRVGRMGFSQLAMTLVLILCMTLHKLIGRNLSEVSTPSYLGIRVRKVAFREWRI